MKYLGINFLNVWKTKSTDERSQTTSWKRTKLEDSHHVISKLGTK